MARRAVVRRSIGLALIMAALIAQRLAGFFTQELIAEAAILALFALSLDLLAICGLVSFGHAGLYGVGCYVFAGLTVLAGGNPNLAVPAAVAAGALVAFLVGLFAVRTSGAFFIMVTLAVAEMFYAWAFRAKMFNGADGMGGIPRLDLTAVGIDLNDPASFALALIVVCSLVWLMLELVIASPFGRTLAAIRQNPTRVAALGGRVFAYRLAAFTASGTIAALAGSFKVQHINFISPELVSWFVSGDVLIAVVIGGIGTLVGGPLGATLLVLLKETLSSTFGHWYLFLGIVFGGVALMMPKGLVGYVLDLNDRYADRAAVRGGGQSRDPEDAQRPAGHMRIATGPAPPAVAVQDERAAAALETRALNKSFGWLTVAQDVSLAFALGLRYAIIGPNGAGKTTYFNLLAGTLRPDSGAILFAGQDVTHLDVTQRARIGIARSFQRNNLFADFTVRDNLALACALSSGATSAFWRPMQNLTAVYREAEEIAAAVGLDSALVTAVRHLSYGSQRQLEVALALACRPKVLLLDEPTSGMSPEETARMHALITGLPRSLTVIVIEHDMDVVLDFADRIIVLDYGRVLEQGTPAAIRASSAVRARYLGERGFARSGPQP